MASTLQPPPARPGGGPEAPAPARTGSATVAWPNAAPGGRALSGTPRGPARKGEDGRITAALRRTAAGAPPSTAAGYADPARARPPGCSLLDGATSTGDAAREVREELRARREGTEHAVAAKILAVTGLLPPRAREGADGPAGSSAAVIRGTSAQPRDGADRATLERAAELALRTWPFEANEGPRAGGEPGRGTAGRSAGA